MNAIRATYSDIKTVRTRKVYQIVFEGPIEEMGQAFALFGPPSPDAEVWAGIARLQPPARQIDPPPANDAPSQPRALSQVAGYLCTIVTFRRWLLATTNRWEESVLTAEKAAEEVKHRCGITSRKELDTNEVAARIFRNMRADYDIWMRDAA